MSFTRASYSQVTVESTSPTKVLEESRKKASLLQDNSWIRKNVNEDQPVERDSNFGKTVLSRYKSNENLVSSPEKTSKTETKITTTTTTTSPGTSVQALTRRFGGSQDHLNETRTTGTKTTVKTEPKSSTTTTILKDGTKITETVTTRTEVVKSSTKAETFTDSDLSNIKRAGDYKTEVITVRSSSDTIDGPTSPVKTTSSIKTYKSTEDLSPTRKTSYTLHSSKSTEDLLFDTLIPTSIKTTYTKHDSSEDDHDTAVSKTIRRVSSTNDRYEWNTPTTTYTRTYTESRPIDYLSDSLTSKTSTTVYTSVDRRVSDKDICTYCHKHMYNEPKIILDDMNIHCHAACFKCEVCNASLGHLKAGDSLWVYRGAIHCESCFAVTKGKWRR